MANVSKTEENINIGKHRDASSMNRIEKEEYLVRRLSDNKLLDNIDTFKESVTRFSESILDIKIESLHMLLRED